MVYSPHDNFIKDKECEICKMGKYQRFDISLLEKLMTRSIKFGTYNLFENLQPEVYVCDHCGHIQMFTSKRDLKQMKRDLDKMKEELEGIVKEELKDK